MSTNPEHEVATFLADWTTAETGGDVDTLDRQLADDFTGIGPLGFTLTKTQWLDRHATGALSHHTFALDELRLRVYRDAAVATARQFTDGAYQGHPVPAQMRMTLALTRQPDRWLLAVAHMSFLAGTPGAPPIPHRP